MILVDTSVWIDHFHSTEHGLTTLLAAGAVRIHPAVIGELAVGNIRNRRTTLRDLGLLPSIREATHQETLTLIDSKVLHGHGIDWVDSQLLASAVAAGVKFWVRDKWTLAAAQELGVAHVD